MYKNHILPNFFIVGAVKSGTTSLHNYLALHPQIFMSPIKEPHFFSEVQPKKNQKKIVSTISNIKDYLKLFECASSEKMVGESSPSYLSEIGTAEKIKKCIPHAKIIIMLRNPIERAYSHYLMDVYMGNEKLSFIDALNNDMSLPEKGWGISHMYVELGMYFKQVENYLSVFGPSNVLVIIFEDFIKNTNKTLELVRNFLELDPIGIKDKAPQQIFNSYKPRLNFFYNLLREFKNLIKLDKLLSLEGYYRNINVLKHKKPKMDDASLMLLREVYQNDVENLATLLGTDLSNWETKET